MVVGFTTICTISAYRYWCEFEPHSWRGVLDKTLCDKVCQWLAIGLWFSLGTPVSYTNETNCHDITEIWLKVALNTKNLKSPPLDILNSGSQIIIINNKEINYLYTSSAVFSMYERNGCVPYALYLKFLLRADVHIYLFWSMV
jgi:hypothetical protein